MGNSIDLNTHPHPMTTTLQQLLHDLYQQLMMPEEKNVVSLANRILDAKAELAKQEIIKEHRERCVADQSYMDRVREEYEKRNAELPHVPNGVYIEQRTPSDLGEVH